jgi:pseudaminic acid synthase
LSIPGYDVKQMTEIAPIRIADRLIGADSAPFVVAEMSGNHAHSLERAMAIVEAAARSGVHALKLQTYTADTMTLDLDIGEFRIDDPNSLWNGRTLYSLYEEAHTPWEWHAPLMERCSELGLICFSSPFDKTAVDFLEDLNAPAHKIASFENTDVELLKYVAATGKPVIMSTGMCTQDELDHSVEVLRQAGCKELLLLKCTSAYPAPADAANLLAIGPMSQRYGVHVGLSDHTLGTAVAVAAVAHGAVFIEKHFTLSRKDGGVDAAFSMEPAEMATLVTDSVLAYSALGRAELGPTSNESASLQFRRTLYVVADLEAGDILTRENVRAIRPGLGLAVRHIDDVLGKTVVKPVTRGTALNWDILGLSGSSDHSTGQ